MVLPSRKNRQDGRARAAGAHPVDEVLTPEALEFLAELHGRFGVRRREPLARRQERRAEAARTGRLDFLPETREIREGM